MLYVGVGKTNITAFKMGVGMLGYGMYFNIVKGVETELYARAFMVEDKVSGNRTVFVNAEIAFITIAIKRGVIKKLTRKHPDLGLTETDVFLTAQHTHSAPGGYSHYGLYNMTIPGFVPEVYQQIVDGIVEAIVLASNNMVGSKVKVGSSSFDDLSEVAFNRSLKAYNRNAEVKKEIVEQESHLAIDRGLTMLYFETEDGKPLGSINWFGVHSTSISNDNHRICSDNKGYAAHYMEESMMKKGYPEFVGAFAQKAAGDVSPNWIFDNKKKWTRGKFEDDFESAKFNGSLQHEVAMKAMENARSTNALNPFIDNGLAYVDMSCVVLDPEFAHDDKDARTGPACHGVSFFAGTKEGPGMDPILVTLATALAKGIRTTELAKAKLMSPDRAAPIYDKYRIQGKKDILVEAAECKLLGTKDIKNLIIPKWADPAIYAFKKYHANGSLGGKPLTPQVLPIHISIIGSIAIAGVPGEITTMASKRLEKTIVDILGPRGIDMVIISSYANAYCGYITTYEEYQEQCYEGGHTVFGEHTLGAFQTKFKQLAIEMCKPPSERQPIGKKRPAQFSKEELTKRTFTIRSQRKLIEV